MVFRLISRSCSLSVEESDEEDEDDFDDKLYGKDLERDLVRLFLGCFFLFAEVLSEDEELLLDELLLELELLELESDEDDELRLLLEEDGLR